jgi:hypothetical protein
MRHFIRFASQAAVPVGGRSRNSLTNELEAGVSVYDAEQALDGSWSCVGKPQPAPFHPLMFTALHLRVFLLTGSVLDERGADGEPLLRDVQLVAELVPIEGRDNVFVRLTA